MNASKIYMVIGLALVTLLGVVLVTYIGISNSEVRLRNQVESKGTEIESHHDKMWKTLQQKAQVSEQYRETFERVYPDLIAGRYSGEQVASMFNVKMVTEDNPDFDTSLYRELSRSVEAERTSFHMTQKQLIDLHREHKTLLETFPGSVILTGREPLEITVISSTRTKQVVDSGIDDSVNLF